MKKALLVLLAALGLTVAAQPALAQTYGDWQYRGNPQGYGQEHAYPYDYGYRPWYGYGYRHWYPYRHRDRHPYGYRYGYPYGPSYGYPYGR